MKRMLIHIEESQYETLRRLAFERKTTMSELVREALDEKLRGESKMKKYYKKVEDNEILVKCIDSDNNFSVASNLDPEWDGYTDHQWGAEAGKWTEITEAEVDGIIAGVGKMIAVDGREIDCNVVVNLMDDELREELHQELAPCTNQEFVNEYLKRHKEKFGEEFTVS